jgi:hypothetical protein
MIIRDASGGLGLVLNPDGMHCDPQIKLTMNNGQDTNSRLVENCHRKEEVDDMWARPVGQVVGLAGTTCQRLGVRFALVSSRPF